MARRLTNWIGQHLRGSPHAVNVGLGERITDRYGHPYGLQDDSDEKFGHFAAWIDVPRWRWQRPRRERAGYINLTWDTPDVLRIADLWLDPPFRKRGLGTHFMNLARRYAHDYGATQIVGYVTQHDLLETPRLLEWYEGQDFVVTRAPDRHRAATLVLDLLSHPDPESEVTQPAWCPARCAGGAGARCAARCATRLTWAVTSLRLQMQHTSPRACVNVL